MKGTFWCHDINIGGLAFLKDPDSQKTGEQCRTVQHLFYSEKREKEEKER
jgi:hypothetical protein